MNNRILKYLALSLGVLVGLSFLRDFLDRPTERQLQCGIIFTRLMSSAFRR